jgi:hypothetical protein
MLHNLIFNGRNEDVESLMIGLKVENHEQPTQVVMKDEEKNAEIGIAIDGARVPLHDDEVFGNT